MKARFRGHFIGVRDGRTLDVNGKPLAGVCVSVPIVPYDLEQAGRDEVFELERRAVMPKATSRCST